MSEVSKYGKIISETKGAFPEDEPVFVLRGHDRLAPPVVTLYASLLRVLAIDGSPRHLEQADEVDGIAAAMLAYQAARGGRLPD